MIFPTLAVVAALASTAHAHFKLTAPGPRGYNASQQLQFCSGFPEATSNRTVFPLEGGSVTVDTNHGNWTAAVLVSTSPNANTPEAFQTNGADVFIREFSPRELAAGSFCLPIDLASVPGAVDGANITLQVLFESEDDGILSQCADVTLSSTTTPAGECINVTRDGHAHGAGAHASASASGHDGHDHDHDHDDHEGHDHGDDEDGSSLQAATISGVAAAAMGLLALASL